MPALRRTTSPLPATARSPKGARTTRAMNQRQKFRLTGSNVSRSARPRTQLPAHSRLVSAKSKSAATCELEARSVRLLVSVVGRANEWTDGGVLECQLSRLRLEHGEYRRVDVALDRQVMWRRLQVLTDGEHVDLVRPHIAHYCNDLGIGLAKTDHQARLRRHLRIGALELLQKGKRVLVVAAGSRLLIEPRHGLEVVIHHVGWRRRQNLQRAVHPATEVWHQYFDGGVRAGGANCA